MSKILRIGTRDSELAVWQARQVESFLHKNHLQTELIYVKSPGDIDLTTPLHQFSGTGIFTKILDDALFNRDIDIAVHSLKDYPTSTPEGLSLAAVLKRGSNEDVLVYKNSTSFLNDGTEAVIATGSIRRIAQWKNRYPHHTATGLRGNIQTRLQKLRDSNWNGAIFAKAGLERINLLPQSHIVLDWMIPAPAQGVIGVTCRTADRDIYKLLKTINHEQTFTEACIERQFLQTVEGGCSAPVGALAKIKGNEIHLTAGIFEVNGSKKVVYDKTHPIEQADTLGTKAAITVLNDGGKAIMDTIRNA